MAARQPRRRRGHLRDPRQRAARLDEAALPPTARTHRLSGDDPEDVLTARLNSVMGGLACHQQDWTGLRGTPHPDRVGPHVGRIVGNNIQELRSQCPYARLMSITPHIVVQGAERAVAFYRDAFSAEEVSRIPAT